MLSVCRELVRLVLVGFFLQQQEQLTGIVWGEIYLSTIDDGSFRRESVPRQT
jgi:hypothetical protein